MVGLLSDYSPDDSFLAQLARAASRFAGTPTFNQGLPSDVAQYGPAPQPAISAAPLPPSGPLQANAQMPPAAPPVAPQPSPQPPMQQPPMQQSPVAELMQPSTQPNRLDAAAQSFVAGDNPLSGLRNALHSFILGIRTDPQAVAQRNAEMTYRSLVPLLGEQKALIAAINPEIGKQLVTDALSRDHYSVVKSGQTPLGAETYSVFNQNTGELKPVNGDQNNSQNAGLGNMSQQGPEYLATLPPQVRGTVQAMVEGRQAPPSSFALSKPYWQSMIAAARNVDPNFDEATWKSRAQMAGDLGKSGANSIGGIISNGKSAFEHLANLSDKAADLGNYNGPNIPGGSLIASAENYLGNGPLSNSSQSAKVTAFNDNALKYGQEATKFYAGSGGGEAERMAALKTLNPKSSSANDQAAFLETEKQLMLGRLKQKEDQVRDVLGPAYLAAHPVMTPDLQATIARIDANVAKLRGQRATGASQAADPLGIR